MTWLKQTHDQPLYPDMVWSRPERRDQAGKLLIIGGNLHGFTAPADAFRMANTTGIGVCRLIIPSALKRTLHDIIPDAIYSPSTPSGSFARSGLADWLDEAQWADGVLMAGDFGHNSETALLIENFAGKFSGRLSLCQDAVEYFIARPGSIMSRPNTMLTASIGQLQKLAQHLHTTVPITQAMGLPDLVAWLEEYSRTNPTIILTKHLDHIIIAMHGDVSTTQTTVGLDAWRVKLSALASVWWLQHANKPQEAITCAILDL